MRCPRCREGRIFRGRFAMNDPCPNCGLIFQREEGYFLGAMYASYILSIALIVPLFLLGLVILPGVNILIVAVVALVAYAPFVPAVFRYSRVLWIYFDRAACPSDASAGAYEKVRQQEFAPRDENSS
jgi:hypothetical protein